MEKKPTALANKLKCSPLFSILLTRDSPICLDGCFFPLIMWRDGLQSKSQVVIKSTFRILKQSINGLHTQYNQQSLKMLRPLFVSWRSLLFSSIQLKECYRNLSYSDFMYRLFVSGGILCFSRQIKSISHPDTVLCRTTILVCLYHLCL